MGKLIIKILVFCFLVILLLTKLEHFFVKEDRFNFANYQYNKLVDTTDFGIVFFGSSKSYCSYNPTIFKHNLGVNSYNLAGQGQVLEVTNFVIDEVLKKTRPELIVVDLSYGMINFDENDSIAEKSKSYQLKIFDNYGLSLNKLKYLFRTYKKKKVLYTLSPLIRNHDKWMDIPQNNYKKEFIEERNNLFLYNNGYIGTLHNLQRSGEEIAKDIKLGYDILKNSSNLIVNNKEYQLIKSIYEKAKVKNVKVLFVTAPSIKGLVKHLSFYEDLERLLKSENIDYLNLNKYYYDIGLVPSDYKDIQHMNYSGGFKTSKFLSKYIANQYTLNTKSERNDLDNNVTFHLLTDLKYAKKLLKKEFQFSESIKIKEIAYFKESRSRFSFIFKLNKDNFNKLDNHRGYLRYYNGEIKEENKVVNSFPMKMIKVENELYIFARINIENSNISKLDVFFIQKEPNKVSKFFTVTDLKLEDNEN